MICGKILNKIELEGVGRGLYRDAFCRVAPRLRRVPLNTPLFFIITYCQPQSPPVWQLAPPPPRTTWLRFRICVLPDPGSHLKKKKINIRIRQHKFFICISCLIKNSLQQSRVHRDSAHVQNQSPGSTQNPSGYRIFRRSDIRSNPTISLSLCIV